MGNIADPVRDGYTEPILLDLETQEPTVVKRRQHRKYVLLWPLIILINYSFTKISILKLSMKQVSILIHRSYKSVKLY